MYYVVAEILREVWRDVAAWLDERPAGAKVLAACGGLLAMWGMYLVVAGVFGSSPGAVAFHTVAGTVLYEDGGTIPGGTFMIELFPAGDAERTTGERPAVFMVDAKTGRFSGTMTYLRAHKARTMPYKAVLRTAEQAALPSHAVPATFGDLATTPAAVNLRQRTLAIRVPKPAS